MGWLWLLRLKSHKFNPKARKNTIRRTSQCVNYRKILTPLFCIIYVKSTQFLLYRKSCYRKILFKGEQMFRFFTLWHLNSKSLLKGADIISQVELKMSRHNFRVFWSFSFILVMVRHSFFVSSCHFETKLNNSTLKAKKSNWFMNKSVLITEKRHLIFACMILLPLVFESIRAFIKRHQRGLKRV